ncbi:hypothetical protein HAZT_HAZT005876 [Hyalella azteca]|uniref:lysoplasmalogenase n=1 Tax=Hyalella azteca TaxID=294128 RepID=A0A6A0HBM3_HYAAZ|nr:hypothetical protein HAZT_HAZT005876 [Hyalella azteca]
MLKSGVGPKLVPFFKTVAIYFVVLIPHEQHLVFRAILKALPVISLIAFVLLHGMSFGDEYFYSRRILLGLICSVVGDVLLVWDHLFLHGLGAFLVAQIFYISAFGFKPLNLPVAAVLYPALGLSLYIIVPEAGGALSVGVCVYSFVLATMVLIMGTYYAAQLGISLSVVDCKASYLDSLKRTAGIDASSAVFEQSVSGENSTKKRSARRAAEISVSNAGIHYD